MWMQKVRERGSQRGRAMVLCHVTGSCSLITHHGQKLKLFAVCCLLPVTCYLLPLLGHACQRLSHLSFSPSLSQISSAFVSCPCPVLRNSCDSTWKYYFYEHSCLGVLREGHSLFWWFLGRGRGGDSLLLSMKC